MKKETYAGKRCARCGEAITEVGVICEILRAENGISFDRLKRETKISDKRLTMIVNMLSQVGMAALRKRLYYFVDLSQEIDNEKKRVRANSSSDVDEASGFKRIVTDTCAGFGATSSVAGAADHRSPRATPGKSS